MMSMCWSSASLRAAAPAAALLLPPVAPRAAAGRGPATAVGRGVRHTSSHTSSIAVVAEVPSSKVTTTELPEWNSAETTPFRSPHHTQSPMPTRKRNVPWLPNFSPWNDDDDGEEVGGEGDDVRTEAVVPRVESKRSGEHRPCDGVVVEAGISLVPADVPPVVGTGCSTSCCRAPCTSWRLRGPKTLPPNMRRRRPRRGPGHLRTLPSGSRSHHTRSPPSRHMRRARRVAAAVVERAVGTELAGVHRVNRAHAAMSAPGMLAPRRRQRPSRRQRGP